jgi:hypothetical protein
MRFILILGLMFSLAAVPAVQSQQVAARASAEQPSPRLAEIPPPMIQADLTPVRTTAVESRETVTADAAQEMSARTFLAIIGGALVVLALVVLLR